jgi:hypothetical protein
VDTADWSTATSTQIDCTGENICVGETDASDYSDSSSHSCSH